MMCRSLALSTLLTTSTVGVSTWATRSATKRSPRPIGSVASMTKQTTSTSSRVPTARLLVRSPNKVRGLWMPGVSRNTICVRSVVRTPRTCVRVV